MLSNSMIEVDKKFAIPPKIERAYKNFKLLSETSSYRVFEAKTYDSDEKHIIRILDCTKKYVNKNFSHAATLFVQELLRLQSQHPGSVLTNTFEISENGDHIACATLPYVSLSFDTIKSFNNNRHGSWGIEKLVRDVRSDVEFLWKDLQLRKIMNVLGAENISFIPGKTAFFLCNWAKIYENIESETRKMNKESQENKLNSQDLTAELKDLAIAILTTVKEDDTETKSLFAMPKIKDEKLRHLVGKVLDLDLRNLNLEELGIQEGTRIISNSEESKQPRDELQDEFMKKSLRNIGNILPAYTILSYSA